MWQNRRQIAGEELITKKRQGRGIYTRPALIPLIVNQNKNNLREKGLLVGRQEVSGTCFLNYY